MSITLHEGDLPDGLEFGVSVAIDTETMGLRPGRDRLCLAQLSAGDGTAHLVRFDRRQIINGRIDAPNLKALLENKDVLKLMHFARFDIAALAQYLGAVATPVFCTKIASKLVRTYTDRHGLSELCREMLGVEMSKQQQSSDWGADRLTDAQLAYAASDVLYLHQLKALFDDLLEREGRMDLAQACFNFLPARAMLDLRGWPQMDIFAH